MYETASSVTSEARIIAAQSQVRVSFPFREDLSSSLLTLCVNGGIQKIDVSLPASICSFAQGYCFFFRKIRMSFAL